MADRVTIPNAIIGALAHVLDNQYSRPQITSLLMRSGVTGSDPYVSSKQQMITDWLLATNRDHEQPIRVLDGILEQLFDVVDTGRRSDTLEADRKLVRDRLQSSGLSYSKGHVSLSPTPNDRVVTAADIDFIPRPGKTPALFTVPENSTAAASVFAERPAPVQIDATSKNIMVIYGQNEPARLAMFGFLRSLGLRPMEWEALIKQTGMGAPYTGDAVRRGISEARAVVVLLTGDDLAVLRPAFQNPAHAQEDRVLTPQARPNVILEYGMALMADESKIVIVELEPVRGISDTFGRNAIRYGADEARFRHAIVSRLKTIGCDVDDSGPDFLTEGNFATALAYDHAIPEIAIEPNKPGA